MRILAFVGAAMLLLYMAMRHRVHWWQIGWLLIVVLHQIVFVTWVGVVTVGRLQYNQRFIETWSTCVDLHLAFAVIAYVAVLLIQERDNDLGRFVAAYLPGRIVDRDRPDARSANDERGRDGAGGEDIGGGVETTV